MAEAGGEGALRSAYDVLIVGAGHGGAQAAIALRQLGFAGSIALLGREREPPYERPPLSKDYLAGDKTFERLLIRPPAFWAERDIALRGGHEVVAVEPAEHFVTLADGAAVGCGTLVWAAGGTPRRLTCPGGDLAGIHTIRTRADVDAVVAALPNVRRVAVVGGGYVGLEAAAVLRGLGREVVLIEAADRILARVAGAPLADFFAAEHRARGVDVRTGAQVIAIEGEGGRVAAVRLADGARLTADLVIVGIGIEPQVAPLRAAGAAGTDGVDVDAFCRTTLPDIYAIGDCAAQASRFAAGARVRIESVQNAHDQAKTAAQAIAGAPRPHDATPWFWSNQYDLKLQTVGLSVGHDAWVVRGDRETRSFSIVYLRGGRVVALDCVNAVRDYVQGRRLVEAGAIVAPAALADAGRALKESLPESPA